MRDRFGSVKDVDGVKALGAEDRALLKEYAGYLENFDYDALLTGGNDFVGTVALNIIFNFISDMLKEALDSVSSVG